MSYRLDMYIFHVKEIGGHYIKHNITIYQSIYALMVQY